MNTETNESFWAIVELFGHTILSGEVSKCEIGDFIQINIPQVDSIPPWTKMVNPKAVYGITPVTKDVAISRAQTLKSMPIDRWDADQLFRNRLAEMEETGQIKMIEE